jgi:hypothetical protein
MTTLKTRTRAETFFLIISCAYLIIVREMIGLALYRVTGEMFTLSIGKYRCGVRHHRGVLAFVRACSACQPADERAACWGLACCDCRVPLTINCSRARRSRLLEEHSVMYDALYLIGSLLKRGQSLLQRAQTQPAQRRKPRKQTKNER